MLQFDVGAYSHQQIQNTRNLLHSIAQHLSSKECCRRRTYTVTVTETYVEFETNALLCRSKGDTKSAEPAIWHILREHFNEFIFLGLRDITSVYIAPNSLVPGEYVYRCSVSGKQRRWFKEDQGGAR